MKKHITLIFLFLALIILGLLGTLRVNKTNGSKVQNQFATPDDRLFGDFNLNNINYFIDEVNRRTDNICERETKKDSLFITLNNTSDSLAFNRIFNHGKPTQGKLSFYRYKEDEKHYVTLSYEFWSSILLFFESNLPSQQ